MRIKLGDLTKIKTGKLDANAASEDGQYPFFTCSKEPLRISTYSYDCESVLIAGNGDLNVKYYNGKFDAYQRTYIIENKDNGKLFMPYLYFFMEAYIEELRKQAVGGVIKYIKIGNLTDARIKLPSMNEQKAIAEILQRAKRVIELRKKEISKLDELINAQFVEMFGKCSHESVKAAEVCDFITKGSTPAIGEIVEERKEYGEFKNLEDFISRMSTREALNKRAIENFIKAGALDCLGGTRKQFMSIYIQIVDHVNQEKKYSMTGQMSLFDLVSEEEKSDFQIQLPKVGEYAKETKLAFEKEVLGVYISGHPLEEYEEQWQKAISATTLDFQLDEESNHSKVHDGAREIIGGFITEKTMKATKTNQMMAFVTLEDLLGTVEVVVFPRDYEKNKNLLEVDRKVFIKGRVSEEDDKPSKLICEKVIPFNQIKRELWIQFPDKADYLKNEQLVYGYLADSEGEDEVVIYCQAERAVKRFPKNRNIQISPQVLSKLMNHYGEKRVKVVEKTIENKI